MASQSDLLEAKAQVRYFEIEARSILNRTKPNMPFRWTINPYRGCEFGCKYCYARYTHEYMGMEDGREFEDKIYAKAAAPEILRRELRRVAKTDAIAIGTATDPYQPAERRFGRTRAILEVFAGEKGRSISVTTKSDLVARDIPLLAEMARRNAVSVNITVTTLDADLARMLEPRAPRPDLRLATVGRLAEAGIPVGVFPNPIMPWITDTAGSLERLAAAARRGRRHVLRRRAAIPHALRAEGLLPLPRAALPATRPALPEAVREKRLPARPVQGTARAADQGDPRAARPGGGAGGIPAGSGTRATQSLLTYRAQHLRSSTSTVRSC